MVNRCKTGSVPADLWSSRRHAAEASTNLTRRSPGGSTGTADRLDALRRETLYTVIGGQRCGGVAVLPTEYNHLLANGFE
jgi:hypothetical protein